MPAVAMTDHGNVFGAFEFYKMAKAAGVKPIIGIEAYFTPSISRFERKGVNLYNGGPDDVSARGAYTHMTLLSESTEGMHNLFRLTTGAWRDGFFKHPRADLELLQQHSAGLIGTTGCPSGEVQVHLRHDNYDAARQVAAQLPGRPRPRQLLPRAHGPRARHREPGARRAAEAGPRPRHPAARHQRLPLRAARGRAVAGAPALHQLRLHDGHPGRRRPGPAVRVLRRRLLPEVGRGDAGAVGRQARPARGLRQHAVDRRALRRHVQRERRPVHAEVPVPAGRERGLLAGQGGRAGAAVPLPHGIPDAVRKQADFEVGVITSMGFPATSSSSPTSSTGPRTTASASAPAVAPARARWSPTRCASPTSTRWCTA